MTPSGEGGTGRRHVDERWPMFFLLQISVDFVLTLTFFQLFLFFSSFSKIVLLVIKVQQCSLRNLRKFGNQILRDFDTFFLFDFDTFLRNFRKKITNIGDGSCKNNEIKFEEIMQKALTSSITTPRS